jgi:hypothetical protein
LLFPQDVVLEDDLTRELERLKEVAKESKSELPESRGNPEITKTPNKKRV